MTSRISRSACTLATMAVLSFPAELAAQTYEVTVLQGLGGSTGANGINNRGWVVGFSNQQGNTVTRAVLWTGDPVPIDLGSLGGPQTNSAVAWPVKNSNGVIVGISETTQDNPL